MLNVYCLYSTCSYPSLFPLFAELLFQPVSQILGWVFELDH